MSLKSNLFLPRRHEDTKKEVFFSGFVSSCLRGKKMEVKQTEIMVFT